MEFNKLKRLDIDWIFVKKALRVLVPMVLSSIVVTAISFVDNIMVNGFQRPGAPDKVDYAAVGVVGELWFAFQAFYMATATVFAILYAQFANNKKIFVDIARFNFWYLSVISFTVSGLMFFLNEEFVNLFFLGKESPDDVFIKPIAYDYFKILALGQLFSSFAWNILNPLTIKGKVNYMLYLSLISIALNAGLDYIFIYVNKQGAQGSAWATVISYGVQFIFACYFAFRHWNWFTGFWKLWLLNRFVMREIFRRTYMFLSMALMQIGFGFSTVLFINLYSTALIRPMATGYMVSSIMFTVFQGTNRGIKVFIGPLLGENKFIEAKAKIRQLWYANLILIFTFVMATLIVASFFPQVMLNDATEIRQARNMIFIFAGSYFAYAIITFYGAALETGGHQLVQNVWNYFFQLWASMPMIVLGSHLALDLSFEWNFFLCQFIYYVAALVIFIDYRRFKWLRRIEDKPMKILLKPKKK